MSWNTITEALGFYSNGADYSDTLQAFKDLMEKHKEAEKENARKRNYPRTDLGQSRLMSNHMVFVYEPAGPHVYTGSIDRIEDALKDEPTCHAAVCSFSKRPFKVSFRFHTIVGKYSDKNSRKHGFHVDMMYGSRYEPPSSFYLMGMEEVINNMSARKKFYLVKISGRETEVIRTWRRLPKKYLRELALLDNPNILDEEKGRKNRFNTLEFR